VRYRRGRLHFRLARKARVRIVVRSRGRVVRRKAVVRRAGKRSVRMRLRRGRRYRVKVVARAGEERMRVRGVIRVRRG
jgi:hypothetical protein